MPDLILINEGMGRMVIPLGNAVVCIGSDPESDIMLDCSEISMRHASISFHEGKYVVRDNGSANGTLVNGVKASERTLMHNDQLTFGPFHFLVDLGDKEIKKSPAAAADAGVTEAAARPVPRAVPPSGLRYLFGAVVAALAVVVAVGGLVQWATENQKSQQILLSGKKVRAEWQLRLKKSEEHVRQLEKAISEATSQIAETQEQLRNVSADAARFKEDNALVQVALREGNDKLKKLEEAPAKAGQASPASTPVDQTNAGPDLASMRAAIAAKLDPLKLLPEAEYPPKVEVVEATEIPMELNGQVVGKRKIAQGLTFSVVGVDKDSVVVDMAGGHVKIGKEFTNFQVALGELNEGRRKENAKMREDREAEIGRLAEAAAAEEKQLIKAREELLKARVRMEVVAREVLKNGILGTVIGGTSPGLQVYLTGGDAAQIPVGQTWSGDAFPMGLFRKPQDDVPSQHFSVDIKEFEAFRNGGGLDDAAVKEVMEASVRKNQEIVAKIDEVMKALDEDKVAQEVARMRRVGQPDNIKNSQFVRAVMPNLKKAGKMSQAYAGENMMPQSVKDFFDRVSNLAGECSESNLRHFLWLYHNVTSDSEQLKASMVVQTQAIK